ncbi:MAG: DUF4293 family protein [Sphingobacteriia bacterium]|nr:DUF4293 family protein [Sphingobacteriia bacterium]
MIQRIQTLWFLIAGISALLSWVFPFCFFLDSSAEIEGQFRLTGIELQDSAASQFFPATDSIPGWILLILAAMNVFLPFVLVGLFKNRRLQITISTLALTIPVIGILAAFLFINSSILKLEQKGLEEISIKAGWAIVLPLITLLGIGLGRRGVKKDEALIRSMDRIR